MPMKYMLRSAMRRSRNRKPPSLHLQHSTRDTSPRCSSVLSDWDADDEGFMSSGDLVPSRPLSLSIPSGPYCPRRPTLQEVLANSAPPPWTLSAFTAYLSQNHCLETLEFTMDAQRYTSTYKIMIERDPLTPISPSSPDCEYMRMLWQRLLDAYIVPNGPREINLPSDVRKRLLSLPNMYTPPDPTELEPAVKIINELMDESVLVNFLNSVAPPRASDESMTDLHMAASLDERSLSPSQSRRAESPPICGSGQDAVAQTSPGVSPRVSHHSHLTAALGRAGSSRLSALISGSSATSSSEAPESMTDDSTDSPSPSGSAMEPMTPPSTPPTSHVQFEDISPGSSPMTIRPEGSSWRAKLGWKKSRSGGTPSSRYPMREGSDDSGGSGL
jgi:hypothetical protein